MISFFRYLRNFIVAVSRLIGRAIVALIPDAMFLSGLGLIGYGLYLFEPWISFTVVGSLLSIFALISKRGG